MKNTMRITNIDTLSAYLDRLITENIKLYFFKKDGLTEKANHQLIVISEIKTKISELIREVVTNGSYEYIEEYRTFNEGSIIEELDELIQNDINMRPFLDYCAKRKHQLQLILQIKIRFLRRHLQLSSDLFELMRQLERYNSALTDQPAYCLVD